MFNLDKLYSLRTKIPKNIRKIIPKFIRRKINKKFFKYYFLQTDLKKLPNLNYPEDGNLEYQKYLIEKFNKTQKQNSFMTYPNLLELLSTKFTLDDNFTFLDIGGEKIDFYLSLKKKFKNVQYFLFNQNSMLSPFDEIKKKFDYKDLHLIHQIDEIFRMNFSFTNFGSSIQYLDNYEILLEKITNNTKHIFFSGTHLYNSSEKKFEKNTIVKQVNVLPKINFNYFFNRQNFFNILKKKDYELIFEKKNLTDNVNYDNFNNYLKNLEYSDFLFTKKTTVI